MPPQTIETRVESLEHRVTHLDGLPERVGAVEAQIVQFRAEVRDECSAVREEMASGFAEVRAEIEETRRFMRMLHEEVISRIATMGEGQGARRARKKKSS